MKFSESDLKFIVETLVSDRAGHAKIIETVRDKEDLLEPMLNDPALAQRLLNEEEIFVRVSPYLMFSILLRRVRADLEGRDFVLEVEESGKRIPIFQARAVVRLLKDPMTLEYLAEMLCSFVRTNTAVLYWKERGTWRKRKISDISLDDMITLCQLVEPEFRPRIYKRIGDIALFLTGIYPDHAGVWVRRPRTFTRGERSIADYEQEGRRFYALAAQCAEPPWT
ncbi:MAG: hypothetical protein N3G20_08650, partial [Verrucomicrobiae bacterium]|nr:hypothetical protein [Verrucomicrobiae bacterium]